ncbi:hypothetical protein GGS26DRAFT_539080 [Hypomontagnella submonticulosa]|nr:hypothetical protein GGS26DRAFT_539080 [Hypomontagnella submonticulosa]
MEAQPSSAAAPPKHSPSPAQAPSPGTANANPAPNPATHYPNGLPRSINGLKSNPPVNGSGNVSVHSARPTGTGNGTGNGNGTPAATTPVQPSVPSPTVTTAPVLPVPAPAPVSTSTSTSAPPLPPIHAAPPRPLPLYTASMSQPPQPRQHLPRQSSGSSHKISIVDPPGALSRAGNNPNSSSPPRGFPSPKRDHQRENPKFADDQSRLTHAIQQSVSSAVRRVIRDNWEKCLLGSEFHHAFLLNAVIHHSNGVIIRRSLKDFGAKMVSEAKHEIVAHLSSTDIDELSDDILEKASDRFLDLALQRRLRTIDARSLINALAHAERLGYENSDILEEQNEQSSRFNPAPALFDPSPNPAPTEPASRLKHRSSLPSVQQTRAPAPVLQCPLCWRKFEHPQPYEYHIQKQVCTKEPPTNEGFPFSCGRCGAGFITKVGQQYHLNNHVCGEHGTMPATPRAPVNAASPITLSSGNNSPVQHPAAASRPSFGQDAYRQAVTPMHPRESLVGTPKSQSRDQDPYAHLNPGTLERLNEELQQAEITYTARIKEAEGIQDPAQRQLRLDGLQNSFSTKQSIIRKKYGVRLRNRRTKAEIDSERQRMGWKHGSPGQPEGAPSAKRQRTDDGPSHAISQPESSGSSERKASHLPVSDMTSGLAGSNATAATTDPTLPKSTSSQQQQQQQESAENSLSSYQRKGYRVSSHLPQPSQPSSTDTMTEGSVAQRNGSASAPLVVDEESSDSDSDEDIPASLPPTKVIGTPSRALTG